MFPSSPTNTLSSSTDVSGSNLSQKTVPDSDKQELKDAIMQNNFFECEADYPPEKEDDLSLVAYSLTVTVGNKHIQQHGQIFQEKHLTL